MHRFSQLISCGKAIRSGLVATGMTMKHPGGGGGGAPA